MLRKRGHKRSVVSTRGSKMLLNCKGESTSVFSPDSLVNCASSGELYDCVSAAPNNIKEFDLETRSLLWSILVLKCDKMSQLQTIFSAVKLEQIFP